MIKRLTQLIINYRWFIIIFISIGTIFLGYQLRFLKIDADIINSLPDNDPDALLLKQVSKNFGGNNMGIVILEAENIYDKSVIEDVRDITDTLSNIDGILSVQSLTNIINIVGQEDGFEIGKLVDEYDIPETKEDLEILRNKVLSNDMYRGSIVSEDGTATLIIFTLKDGVDVKQVAQTVLDKTEGLSQSGNLYYIGSPMLVTYISDLMKKDLISLLPIAFLVIALILFFSFRSLVGVIMPLLTAVIAIIWSLGLMSLTGFSMSMISNNIPIILLAVGSAYTIHVLNRINQVSITDPSQAIRKALNYIFIPVLLAATTTAIGFVSFIFGAYFDMIVDFGIFTALGTGLACFFSIFLVPALLEVFRYEKKFQNKGNTEHKKSLLEHNILLPLKEVLFKHPKFIIGIWSVLIIISIVGVFFIQRSVDIQDYFKKGNPTREAERIMIEKFGGTKPIFVLFKGDMQSPDVLKTMIETASYMKKSPEIVSSQSIADLIVQLNDAVSGNKKIPDERDKIEQLWFLLDGNEVMQRFVSESLDEGIIISKFKSPDNESKKVFASYMNSYIQEHSTEKCKIEITGMPFVDITMDKSLVNSQIGSIIIAIIFVIIFVGLILRSMWSGVYSAIPIIAAIIILFGVMGLTGIPLNIATVLVASVALGIGIDYSIHIVSNFNHSFNQNKNVSLALGDAIMISGKAIVINVISVSAGFLVLVFSQLVPLQYFGILIALSMVGSSLGALTLLPVILILTHKKQRNNY